MAVNMKRVYSELYAFLKCLGPEYYEKIPQKNRNFIKANRDRTYNPMFNRDQELKENEISKRALVIILAFYVKFWCDDKLEKQQIFGQIIKNSQENRSSHK